LENKIKVIGVQEFLREAMEFTVVDVRSPAEFTHGQIPGAVNIPLFSNDERASVGTIYKRKGEKEATLKGLDYVGPKMSELLKKGISTVADKGKLLVHCWRGGRRSASMAWLFSQAGIECILLDGGYKSYRQYVLETLADKRNIIVVGGMTGSGKTDVLKQIARTDEQVIDLEGLANHRGSAFGAIGMPPQPTTEQFSNLLFNEIVALDPKKRIFLEDESLNIGSVFMPEDFYNRIRESRVLALMCDVKTRMPRLLEEYGKMPEEMLENSINRIRKRLGGKDADEALKSIRDDNMERAIEIVLSYYDKFYTYGLSRRDKSMVTSIETDSGDASVNAKKILDTADDMGL
jgi:tRNA 2-selenouridine synthase